MSALREQIAQVLMGRGQQQAYELADVILARVREHVAELRAEVEGVQEAADYLSTWLSFLPERLDAISPQSNR